MLYIICIPLNIFTFILIPTCIFILSWVLVLDFSPDRLTRLFSIICFHCIHFYSFATYFYRLPVFGLYLASIFVGRKSAYHVLACLYYCNKLEMSHYTIKNVITDGLVLSWRVLLRHCPSTKFITFIVNFRHEATREYITFVDCITIMLCTKSRYRNLSLQG